MADCSVPEKRRKIDNEQCVICGNDAPSSALVKPKDSKSWQTLYEAAQIRLFDRILNLKEDDLNTEPNVFYHRECRSDFTHKKELTRLKNLASDREKGTLVKPRQSLRQGASETTRVYDRSCIFCERNNKCLKGRSTREKLIQATDLRADLTLRSIATQRGDPKILAVTSRDIVAAEACYHASCYKKYSSSKKQNTVANSATIEKKDDYKTAETKALQMLYQFVRISVFSNPRLVPLVELTSKITAYIRDEGIEDIRQSTKSHVRRNLESEIGDTLHFFTAGTDIKVYVIPRRNPLL